MKSKSRLLFLDAFQKLKNQHSELRLRGPIVCAVSGGIDSICLLSLVNELSNTLNVIPIVAHLDHGVRPNSVRDQEFVQSFAAELGLTFYTDRLGPPPPDRNLEAWMRESRYDFLERVRIEAGAELILTAHHAGDQEETLLMHLLTNRLPKSDSLGIRFYDPERQVFRPLLQCTKEELETHVRERKLNWIEDETNRDSSFLRNRVRQEILPYLQKELNPNVTHALHLLSQRISSDEELIANNLPDVREFLSPIGAADDLGLRLRPLVQLPIAARWRMLRDFLQHQAPQLVDRVSFNRLFSVAEALDEYPDKLVVFELGDGITFQLVSGGVLLLRKNQL